MDEALACARVKVQYGDDEQKIEVKNLSCHDLNSATRIKPITLSRQPTGDSETYRFQLNHALWTASIGWIGRNYQHSSSWFSPSQRKGMAYLEEAGKDQQMFSWQLSPSPSSWNSRMPWNTIKVINIYHITCFMADTIALLSFEFTMFWTNWALTCSSSNKGRRNPSSSWG